MKYATSSPLINPHLIAISLLIWSIFLLFESRYHFLDDAFIHLRYAENWSAYSIFSYNGSTPDFGISSPAYPILLSSIIALGPEEMAPKYISGAFYLLIILWVLFLFTKETQGRILFLIILFGLASPSAIRWLTDGMETSIVAFLSICIAYSLNAYIKYYKKILANILFILLAVAPMFRIEFFAITLFSLIVTLYHCRAGSMETFKRMSPILLSPFISITFYLIQFGSLMPDTGIAKASGSVTSVADVLSYLKSIALAHAASPIYALSMGLGLTVGYFFIRKEWANISPRKRAFISFELIVVIAMVTSFLILLVIRGQSIQGIRHFIWIETFCLFFVAFGVIMRYTPEPHSSHNSNSRRWTGLVIGLVIIVSNIFGYRIFSPVYEGRSESFLVMRMQDRSRYENTPCAAYDVGFFGYFYNCQVFDLNGLVNGSSVARMSGQERHEMLRDIRPKLLFVDGEQLDRVLDWLHAGLDDLVLLEQHDFPNAGGSRDTHFVFSVPSDTADPTIDR